MSEKDEINSLLFGPDGRSLYNNPEIISVDASEIYPGLWQGSVPPRGDALKSLGFTHVVLCAHEFQFDDPNDVFDDVEVIRCPFEDFEQGDSYESSRSKFNWPTCAIQTGRKVADHVRLGSRVLVTCAAGFNRSGLVVGIALSLITGLDGRKICQRIRERRSVIALSNTLFTKCLYGEHDEFNSHIFNFDK